jgi:hypothetical protein
MEIPTYILFLLGCLGAADIFLFHSVAHGIRSHPDSVGELVTHSLRGPTYAALFVLIPNFAVQGLFAWGLLALFAFDVAISIWDFSLEQQSRRFLGGLPGGEYVLHMLIAMVFGGLVAAFLHAARHGFHAATRLAYAPAEVPTVLRFVMLVMAILVLLSGAQDAVASFRLARMLREKCPIGTATMLPDEKLALSSRRGSSERALQFSSLLPLGSEAGASQVPRWMRSLLVAAGIYNLLWGAWVVLFPGALFAWAGMTSLNYPQLRQCVGMIVGLYGIGYIIAAQNPLRHWPIVLVGLLGKTLGPLGMCWSLFRGDLPIKMAWICLTNDLMWWGPFAWILCSAYKFRRPYAGKLNLSQTI